MDVLNGISSSILFFLESVALENIQSAKLS